MALGAERCRKGAGKPVARPDGQSRPAAGSFKPRSEMQIPTMNMKRAHLIAAALIGSSLVLGRPAAAADAPTVDSILARHLEAVGGKEAMQKVHSRLIQVRIESESIGNGEGEIYAKAPDRQRSHIELGGLGAVDEGFDGTVAWAKSAMEGVRVKTGDELAKVRREAQFNPELKLKSLYPDLAYKGMEKVGDEDAWVLESRPSATSKERFWFSAKTVLLVRIESEYEGPQGVINANLFPGDYKVFDGLKLPCAMKLKTSSGGQGLEFTIKFLSVKHNVEVDDSKFAKPAE